MRPGARRREAVEHLLGHWKIQGNLPLPVAQREFYRAYKHWPQPKQRLNCDLALSGNLLKPNRPRVANDWVVASPVKTIARRCLAIVPMRYSPARTQETPGFRYIQNMPHSPTTEELDDQAYCVAKCVDGDSGARRRPEKLAKGVKHKVYTTCVSLMIKDSVSLGRLHRAGHGSARADLHRRHGYAHQLSLFVQQGSPSKARC